ncbi:MAG: hypothetical protein LBB82_00780, partial [Treponema sp.]|nr:hypothetical protein [Treponema sp.]
RLQKFGIKPDGIINFLSNEPPFKPTQRLRYRGACPAEAHFSFLRAPLRAFVVFHSYLRLKLSPKWPDITSGKKP